MQCASSSIPARIALITGDLNLGGVTTFLCNLGGELVRRKVPAAVFNFRKDNPMTSDFVRADIPVLCLDDRRVVFEDRLKTVLLELGRFKPSVVMATHDATSFEVLRYLPSGVFRVGVGQSDHPGVYEMMRHYAPHMDLLAVVSETMKTRAEAMPEFGRVPVRYLPYGVPIPPDDCLAARRFDRPLRILYLGRLSQAQKRVRSFPAILEWLKSSGIPFHWTVAGEGPEKEFLERTMKGSDTQTISFPGKILYADVPRILSEHDVFLLASDHEGLPLSLLEAMGHGLVPVISDLESGVREVVDAATGILVPVDDVAGYARAIIHLHEHRAELAVKSAAARARVKTKFSTRAMADRWLAAFPKESPAVDGWPSDWDIKPPLPARHPVYFSPAMRALRRLAAKFRK
jgi:glycosyltransferase involved in cell wall biosynthesis